MSIEQSVSTPRNNGRAVRKIAALLAGAALIYIVVYGWPGTAPLTCKSLVSDAVTASKENSTGFGPKIIDIVDEKFEGSDPDGYRCSGTAMLSNALSEPVKYSTYKQHDKWWVKVEPTGSPTD